MIKKYIINFLIFSFAFFPAFAQLKSDTIVIIPPIQDTLLRIKNINPYFSIHVDSTLKYQLNINKDIKNYYWFLKGGPVGLKINKDNGLITFKAEKSYFLSGRLKYDFDYKVNLSVQNLDIPTERIDTSFTILFYNTEIIPSKLKPTVTNIFFVDEGDTVSFKIQCDNGNFPIEEVTYLSNYPIKSLTPITKCNDDFTWYIPFDFVKESDKDKQKKLDIYFIGINKFGNKDTALIEIYVRENINYPQQLAEFVKLRTFIEKYIVQLKASFRILDKKVRKNKNTRSGFDLASATTVLGGTIFSTIPNQQTLGKILPSVGITLVPVREATAPNNNTDQNIATLIRSSIKRLEYLMAENSLTGDRDPEILIKQRKLKDELKQTQIQLIDIPIVEEQFNDKDLDDYFNSPKVNKKYRLKRN